MSLSREDFEKQLEGYNNKVKVINDFKQELEDARKDAAFSAPLEQHYQELQKITLEAFNSINLDDYDNNKNESEKLNKELEEEQNKLKEANSIMDAAKSEVSSLEAKDKARLEEKKRLAASAAAANATPAAASASPATPATPAANPNPTPIAKSPNIKVEPTPSGITPTLRTASGGRPRSQSASGSPTPSSSSVSSSNSSPLPAKASRTAASPSATIVKSAPVTPSSSPTSTPSSSASSSPAPTPPASPRGGAATPLTDDDKKRADHIEANFTLYLDKIDFLEKLAEVDKEKLNTHFNKYEKSDPTKGIERLQKDLKLYIAYLKEEDKEEFIPWGFGSNSNIEIIEIAEKYLKKLDKINNILNDPLYGMRHFSHSSLKVTGKDDATFNKAIEDTEEKLLKDYKLSSPATLAVGYLATEKDKPHTKDFHKLGAYKGRVNLTETKSHKSNKTVIVSIEIQRFNKSAGETHVKFKQFDDSRSLRIPWGGQAALLPNDRVLKHAIKIVTNHMLANGKKPIYCNGNLPDTFTEAVMLFANRMGVECHDTRNGKDCKIIRELDPERVLCYNALINNNRDRFLGEAAVLYTTKGTIDKMVDATAEQAPVTTPPTTPGNKL